MSTKFELGDIVILKDNFFYENKLLVILGTKQNPMEKTSPFSFEKIKFFVKEEFDFILALIDNKEITFNGLDKNGLQVKSAQIELFLKKQDYLNLNNKKDV